MDDLSLFRVDNLSLLKVLADRSRCAIYQQLAASDEPLPTTEISRRLNLHPNTVRLHLEKMRDAHLVEAAPDRHGNVGRPQYRWRARRPDRGTAVTEAPGAEAGGFRLLSLLLAELAAGGSGTAAQVGRREGERRCRARAARGTNTGSPPATTAATTCVRAFMAELSELGFDPVTEAQDPPGGDAGDGSVAISFTRCPFRELAVLYPDLVCELHRGMSDGIASAAGEAAGVEARVGSFSSLVDQDPCRAELTLGAV